MHLDTYVRRSPSWMLLAALLLPGVGIYLAGGEAGDEGGLRGLAIVVIGLLVLVAVYFFLTRRWGLRGALGAVVALPALAALVLVGLRGTQEWLSEVAVLLIAAWLALDVLVCLLVDRLTLTMARRRQR